jgi:hypothetical protein
MNLKTAFIAARYGVHHETARGWFASGELVGQKTAGGHWRTSWEEILIKEGWIKKGGDIEPGSTPTPAVFELATLQPLKVGTDEPETSAAYASGNKAGSIRKAINDDRQPGCFKVGDLWFIQRAEVEDPERAGIVVRRRVRRRFSVLDWDLRKGVGVGTT